VAERGEKRELAGKLGAVSAAATRSSSAVEGGRERLIEIGLGAAF
jgi:hypothetical protein